MNRLAAVVLGIALVDGLTAPRSAWAHSFGSVGSCAACHGSGATPSVTLTPTPACLTTNMTGNVDVTISAVNGGRGGLDLSITGGGGLLSIGGASSSLTQISGADITQNNPKGASGGLIRFSAAYTAGPAPGLATFHVYGLASNDNGGVTGDGTGQANASITIDAPPSCGVRNCGSVTNACGQSITCGICSAPQVCGGSGVCAAPPTVPATGTTWRFVLAGTLLVAGVLSRARRGRFRT